ncbi:hypothetical protein HYT25_04995 [Candidatus Pacearchaeota archaeon]|nr:hypothetical protein [Candidatus Pacearchaeota archaeon]
MAGKNLIDLSEIPIGNVVPNGDSQVGYRNSIIYRGKGVEYFLSLPYNKDDVVDVKIRGYIRMVSRDDEENGHEPISEIDRRMIKKLIGSKVKKLPVSSEKKLKFDFLE